MFADVVLVAAGRGRRFGPAKRSLQLQDLRGRRAGPLPKQFLPLKGKPLLAWSLAVFQKAPAVRRVALVVPGDFVPWARAFVKRGRFSKVFVVARGGAERADSVRMGLSALDDPAEVVLIHDAARPLVTPAIVMRVIAAARRAGAALAAWPVPDTLKEGGLGTGGRGQGKKSKYRYVQRTISRNNLWAAQTPQGFRREVAAKVFAKTERRFTDDAQAAEHAGYPVELVLGSPANVKVTLPEDFAMCRRLIGRGLYLP